MLMARLAALIKLPYPMTNVLRAIVKLLRRKCVTLL